MRNKLATVFSVCLLIVGSAGCEKSVMDLQKAQTKTFSNDDHATFKVTNASVALSMAATKQTNAEQVQYLLEQANNFMAQKRYVDVIQISQHILLNLEKDSEEADKLYRVASEKWNKMQEESRKEAEKADSR